MRYHQITTFTISKDKWNTKEEDSKSMKNALCVLQYAKKNLLDIQTEVTLNSEKI